MLHPTAFDYLRPSEAQQATMSVLRIATANYAAVLERTLPEGADKTYLLRKLREVGMWANVAVTRQSDGTPRTEAVSGEAQGTGEPKLSCHPSTPYP